MTDPKLISATIYQWANITQRIGSTVHALLGNGDNGRLHIETVIADLEAQMRDVARKVGQV